MDIPSKAIRIIDLLETAGARDVLVVGGFVRDALLGITSKDIDIEVFGLTFAQIEATLSSSFRVDLVGESFSVVKIDNDIDVSLPRRENKVAVGHRGFEVVADPTMDFTEAASRRDFTINAMGMRRDGSVIDPYGGQKDLSSGTLRHTSPAFAEDPLRVLRGMRFGAQLGFDMAEETLALCRSLLPEAPSLAVERIFGEWRSWAQKAKVPSLGLSILNRCGWLSVFPQLAALAGAHEDLQWSSGGDLLTHTSHAVDAAARIAHREGLGAAERGTLLFAALTHDMGKPEMIARSGKEGLSGGRVPAGADSARDFLAGIGAPNHLVSFVCPLVGEHLVYTALPEPTAPAVRRLALRLAPASIEWLDWLIEADHSGRSGCTGPSPFAPWAELAEGLSFKREKPSPILMGRHLIERGEAPGPEMGRVLEAAFEAQLDGAFHDLPGAHSWLLARDVRGQGSG